MRAEGMLQRLMEIAAQPTNERKLIWSRHQPDKDSARFVGWIEKFGCTISIFTVHDRVTAVRVSHDAMSIPLQVDLKPTEDQQPLASSASSLVSLILQVEKSIARERKVDATTEFERIAKAVERGS